MKRSIVVLVSMVLLAQCDLDRDTTGGSRKNCDLLTEDGPVHVSVIAPNGGESYAIGDTLWMEFCSVNDDEWTVGQANRFLSIDDRLTWLAVPPRQVNGRYYWVVDSIMDAATERLVWPVSDVCYIRLSVYSQQGDPSVDFDESDGPFRILP